MSAGISVSGYQRWDFNCNGNFIAGANASSVGGAMLTINDAGAFHASFGSIIHDCEFDAAGNFARDLTMADWDWDVVNRDFQECG